MEQDTSIYNTAVAQIGNSIRLLAHQARIKTAMDIHMFLNPADEIQLFSIPLADGH